MKTNSKNIFKDATFNIGIGLILLSLGIFMLPEISPAKSNGNSTFGIFVLNYLIAIIYFIIVWIREIPGFRIVVFLQKIEYGFIHLILCLISAYSLNRQIPIFEHSTTWLQVALTIQGFVLLSVFIKNRLPQSLQFLFWLLLGVVFSLFVYYSLTLIPVYPLGLIAGLGLGISLHAFVPLWFVIAILIYLFRKENRTKQNIIGFSNGIIISIAVVILFMIKWNSVNQIILRATNKIILEDKNELPEWTTIAQQLPQNAVSEKILKTSLVYSVAPDFDHWNFFDMPNRNFDEVKKHDPLVMIATFFFGKPDLTDDSKIKILESMYDSRHQAQERLWSGDDLETKHVLTNIRIYPSLRIGYTEKTITIRNNNLEHRWRPEQEAIYTFHLPEGTVVTSLSLWINGKEEKAVLTSKNKADSAYRTVVGVESRDPSLVRWQEGNTVSVRVFPCSPNEDRRFKIGFTSPLRKTNNNLIYENIWFDGPIISNTDETIKINTMDDLENIIFPAKFAEESTDTWLYEGRYMPDWQLKIPEIPIKPNNFSFDEKSYSIHEYKKSYSDFTTANIYLDVNKQWTKDEFDLIVQNVKSKNVFAYQNKLIKITKNNAEKLFTQLQQPNFTVFPVYEIKDPLHSVLITKGDSNTPNVSDLDGSEFAAKLKNYIAEHPQVNLFSLNNELSPYLKTLKELRVFNYDSGNANDLVQLLSKNQFVNKQEDSANVVINNAGIIIKETKDSVKSNAPDHLMRLYSYNNVMFHIGKNYFDKTAYNQKIVDDAYKAYVVSPVTSLVVLETKKDYERFGIKDDGKSLKNASMHSSGAVPEPHEWALIIILAGIATFLSMKNKKISLIKSHNLTK